jgi:hypothetical protein
MIPLVETAIDRSGKRSVGGKTGKASCFIRLISTR